MGHNYFPLHPVSEANDHSPFGSLDPSEFYNRHSVTHSSHYVTNSRGLRLFTQSWAPMGPPDVVGVVAVVHGFTGESSWLLQLTSVLFARSGFAVVAIDLPGHGLSEGLRAHVPDVGPLVSDCAEVFSSFRAGLSPSLPAFLYAESFGGAVALLLTLRQRGAWDGLVLSGAMCGIGAGRVKPTPRLERALGMVAAVAPTRHLLPARWATSVELAYKVEWKRRLVAANPRKEAAAPRAATARELLRVCREVQGRFGEVEVALLIVHGGDDVVCDPQCAKDLYCFAASRDKTIKIYPGMYHQLVGESQQDVDMVFGNILDWLRTRALYKRRVYKM